jgi:hypothetical protein
MPERICVATYEGWAQTIDQDGVETDVELALSAYLTPVDNPFTEDKLPLSTSWDGYLVRPDLSLLARLFGQRLRIRLSSGTTAIARFSGYNDDHLDGIGPTPI